MNINFLKILFFIFLLNINYSFAEKNSAYPENTIILKLKTKYRNVDLQIMLENNKLLNNKLSKGFKIEKIFKNHNSPSAKFNTLGLELIDLSLIYELKLNKSNEIYDIINQLEKLNIFEYVEIKNIPTVLDTPNDPFLYKMYSLAKVNAYNTWDLTQGDTNIVIGIIDTGNDIDHPDLINSVKYNYNDPIDGVDNDNDGYIDNFMGWDMGENDNNPQVNTGTHGVFVAGLSSATVNNTTGIAGIGYNCKFMPIKATNSDGYLTKTYESIVYAADHNCKIINCSWGGTNGFSNYEQDIINYATINKDALIIAACGNDNNNILFYPASYQNLMSVANTDSNDIKFNTSSFGYMVDVSAPGGNVFSTTNGGSYAYSSGTSFSSPIVAGCAALLRSQYPELNALQIMELLRVNTDNIDTISSNKKYSNLLGNGRVNVLKAMNKENFQSVRISKLSNNSAYFESKKIGDTVLLDIIFTNWLDTLTQTEISIEKTSNYIDLIDSISVFANKKPLEQFNNFDKPFSFVIKSACNQSQELWLKVNYKYSNGNKSFEFIKIDVNANYVTINNGSIKYSLTGNGKIGYNNTRKQQGEGFALNNSDSYLYFGGFVAGCSYFKVSDNIYSMPGFIDNDWKTLSTIKLIENSNNRIITHSIFNDDSAGINKMNIEVIQKSYLFKDSENTKFTILEFTVKNKGIQSLSNFYGGLFADWDIANSTENIAKYDKNSKLAYIYNPYEGVYTGITALSNFNYYQYAFDNDGSNSSININNDNNGFSDEEKFISLRTNRDSAGYNYGNDVSHILSYGPAAILPNDSIKFAYAIVVGSHLLDIKTNVNLANLKYQNLLYDINEISDENKSFSIYPNPFKKKLSINCNPNIKIENINIYDILGNKIECEKYFNQNNCILDFTKSDNYGLIIIEINENHNIRRE